MILRVLIVDDEPLARETIRGFLNDEADIAIIGECRNGIEAIEIIQEQHPDVVFLDVQMPKLDGFGVLKALGDDLPIVILLTEFDENTLQPLQEHAVDYLLKPLEQNRFRTALNQARGHVQHGSMVEPIRRLAALLRDVKTHDRDREGLMIQSGGRVFLLAIEEIDWIEAAEKHVKLHAGADDHLIPEKMATLEQELDPGKFCRIHHSAIVNTDRIEQILPGLEGEGILILKDGTKLPVSPSYRAKLEQRVRRGQDQDQ